MRSPSKSRQHGSTPPHIPLSEHHPWAQLYSKCRTWTVSPVLIASLSGFCSSHSQTHSSLHSFRNRGDETTSGEERQGLTFTASFSFIFFVLSLTDTKRAGDPLLPFSLNKRLAFGAPGHLTFYIYRTVSMSFPFPHL